MEKFCHECGSKINKEDAFCPECGTSVLADATSTPKQEQTTEIKQNTVAQSTKKPMSRKQKSLFAIIGILFAVIIGILAWANSYYSAENVEKRFIKAVEEKNTKAILSMVKVTAGNEVTKEEIDAFLAFAKAESVYIDNELRNLAARAGSFQDGLLTIREDGKWLGIIPKHRVFMQGQYIGVEYPFADVNTTLNGRAFTVLEENEGITTYGPLAPGIYQIENDYEGEYAKVSSADEMTLWDNSGSAYNYYVSLDASNIMFEVIDHDLPIQGITLKMGDNEIKANPDLTFDPIGPMSIDGQVKYLPVIEFPWGTIEGEEQTIDDSYVSIDASIVDDEFADQLAEVVLAYGEGYYEALATLDASKVENATTWAFNDLKDVIKDMKNIERNFTGEIEHMEIDSNSIALSENKAYIDVHYYTNQAYYWSDSDPKLENKVDAFQITLEYDQNENKWLFYDKSSSYHAFDSYATVKKYDGNRELYGSGTPDKKAEKVSADTNEKDLNDELDAFIRTYNEKSVEAINEEDISIVEPYIDSKGPRLKEQTDYLTNHLIPNEITQELVASEIESYTKQDDETYEVTTIEEFIIYKPGEENKTKFRTVNLVKKVDDEWKLHELVSTNAID